MNNLGLLAIGAVLAGALPSLAHADRVHLVGGAVIEGKATRHGDKVVVEVESGELALPANEVQRIEASESDVERADAMLSKLAPRDVDGLIALANFCRDHGMTGREQMALQHVIEVAPDHAQARARLGYVRADGTWIKREDQLRAQGMVEYEGKWVTRAEMLQLERMRAEAETARLTRDKAQAEAKKAEAEAEQARAETAAQVPAATTGPTPLATTSVPTYATSGWTTIYPAPYGYASPYAYPSGASRSHCLRTHRGVCIEEAPVAPIRSTHSAFPIAGVRDPFDYFR